MLYTSIWFVHSLLYLASLGSILAWGQFSLSDTKLYGDGSRGAPPVDTPGTSCGPLRGMRWHPYTHTPHLPVGRMHGRSMHGCCTSRAQYTGAVRGRSTRAQYTLQYCTVHDCTVHDKHTTVHMDLQSNKGRSTHNQYCTEQSVLYTAVLYTMALHDADYTPRRWLHTSTLAIHTSGLGCFATLALLSLADAAGAHWSALFAGRPGGIGGLGGIGGMTSLVAPLFSCLARQLNTILAFGQTLFLRNHDRVHDCTVHTQQYCTVRRRTAQSTTAQYTRLHSTRPHSTRHHSTQLHSSQYTAAQYTTRLLSTRPHSTQLHSTRECTVHDCTVLHARRQLTHISCSGRTPSPAQVELDQIDALPSPSAGSPCRFSQTGGSRCW